jgi:Flp pilus assembly protein TadG
MRDRECRPSEAGQAVVELALVAPFLLFLAFGVVAIGRIAQATMAVSAVADEAARTAALAPTAGAAVVAGIERGQQVATGYGLAASGLQLTVDARAFGRGGQIRATVRYTVDVEDLPLLGWAQLPVSSTYVAPIDQYASLGPVGSTP